MTSVQFLSSIERLLSGGIEQYTQFSRHAQKNRAAVVPLSDEYFTGIDVDFSGVVSEDFLN